MSKFNLFIAVLSLCGFALTQAGKKTDELGLPEFNIPVSPSPFQDEATKKEASEIASKLDELGKLESKLGASNDSVMQSISALSRQIGQMNGQYVSKDDFAERTAKFVSFDDVEKTVGDLKKSLKNAGDDAIADPRIDDIIRRIEALELRCGAVRLAGPVTSGGSTGSSVVTQSYQTVLPGYSVSSTSSGGSNGSLSAPRSYGTVTYSPVVETYSPVVYSTPVTSTERVRIVEPREPRRVSYADVPVAVPTVEVQLEGDGCYVDQNGNKICPNRTSAVQSVQSSPRFPRLGFRR